MNDLIDSDSGLDLDLDLGAIAYKGERTASRRLARAQGLTDEQALRQTLQRSAAREALRATAHARRKASHDARHDAQPSAWRAWFDGSARPNPGRCAIGVLLRGPDGQDIELSQPAGHGDSSDAEYRALIALLQTALAHGADDLTIHGDSQVVVNDVTGPDALAAPVLRAYRDSARLLLARFERVSLRWVPRHKNQLADALSQRALPAVSEPEAEPEPDAQSDAQRDRHDPA
jgi:ribonuclease HI